MTKSINPDLDAYKNAVFKGLTLRECIFGALGILVGGGGTLLLHFYYDWNINAAITLCMPMVGVIGLCGFYQKNGMTLVQIIKSVIRLMKQKPFTYETRRNIYEEMEELQDEGADNNQL